MTPINPTPVIGMVGTIDNVKKAISSGWQNIDDAIWLIGSSASESTIAASSYLEYFHGEITGRPPKIDLQGEKFCQSFLRNAILKNYIASAHDISDGGLAIALSESCILSSKGANIDLEKDSSRIDSILFSEGGSRIIFSVKKVEELNWLNYIKEIKNNFPKNFYLKKIGIVSNEKLIIKIQNKQICKLKVEELTEKFNNSISSYFKK